MRISSNDLSDESFRFRLKLRCCSYSCWWRELRRSETFVTPFFESFCLSRSLPDSRSSLPVLHFSSFRKRCSFRPPSKLPSQPTDGRGATRRGVASNSGSEQRRRYKNVLNCSGFIRPRGSRFHLALAFSCSPLKTLKPSYLTFEKNLHVAQ